MAGFDVHVTDVRYPEDIPELEQICQDAVVQAIEDYYSGSSGDGSSQEQDPSSVGGY